MELLHPAMWHDHDIDFARWLHPTMWHVALESWQWIHQVTAPCNVAGGCGMTRHGISPNVRHIKTLHLVSILTISPQSTCHSVPVCEIFIQIRPPSAEKNDVMSILMMANLSHLGFYGFNNGFFEKPMYDFVQVVNRDHSSKLLVFEKIAFFAFWRQTDRQTDELINKQMDSTDALSRSRCRERRLNNQSVNQSVSQSVIAPKIV